MNEFTKEELQIIYNHIYYNAPLSCTIEIRNKIQSMINNFCEHTYVFRCHDDTIYCPKCGKEQI